MPPPIHVRLTAVALAFTSAFGQAQSLLPPPLPALMPRAWG